MALHKRSERAELFDGGGVPKLKVKRGADGKLEVEDPAGKSDVHPETRPDERPAFPDNPASVPNPHTQVF